jgi:hypothetical protein
VRLACGASSFQKVVCLPPLCNLSVRVSTVASLKVVPTQTARELSAALLFLLLLLLLLLLLPLLLLRLNRGPGVPGRRGRLLGRLALLACGCRRRLDDGVAIVSLRRHLLSPSRCSTQSYEKGVRKFNDSTALV